MLCHANRSLLPSFVKLHVKSLEMEVRVEVKQLIHLLTSTSGSYVRRNGQLSKQLTINTLSFITIVSQMKQNVLQPVTC